MAENETNEAENFQFPTIPPLIFPELTRVLFNDKYALFHFEDGVAQQMTEWTTIPLEGLS